jgi:catechol 2,3-dioxygenase-like lactoylglutathione lyase family enzyme
MAALFSRIIPILFVSDLQAERDFYVRLGFHVTYEGPEYPYFLALGHGALEFGIEWREGFSITDLELAKKRLAEAGVRFREEMMTPSPDWQYRVLHARTPNGYHLLLEEGSD